MYFVDVSQFVDETPYAELIERYVEHIKSSRRTPGTDEILMPGEIELRRQAVRQKEGVSVADETWRQLNELANKFDVTLDDLVAE